MADEERKKQRFPSQFEFTDRKEQVSPRREDRRRSGSPRESRREGHRRKKDSGFKWKEKRRSDFEDGGERSAGLQRGYRDHYRPRSRSRSKSPRPRSPRHEYSDRDRRETREQHTDKVDGGEEVRQKKEKKEKKKTAPAVPAQPMIIVYVNDRLGTKKAIPCFATDPISKYDNRLVKEISNTF